MMLASNLNLRSILIISKRNKTILYYIITGRVDHFDKIPGIKFKNDYYRRYRIFPILFKRKISFPRGTNRTISNFRGGKYPKFIFLAERVSNPCPSSTFPTVSTERSRYNCKRGGQRMDREYANAASGFTSDKSGARWFIPIIVRMAVDTPTRARTPLINAFARRCPRFSRGNGHCRTILFVSTPCEKRTWRRVHSRRPNRQIHPHPLS